MSRRRSRKDEIIQKEGDEEIFRKQAAVCRVFTHPLRIRVIHQLENGEKTVNEMVEALQVSQPYLSQHLQILRNAGVVETRRTGTSIHYRLRDKRLVKACRLMRSILVDQLRRAARENQRLVTER